MLALGFLALGLSFAGMSLFAADPDPQRGQQSLLQITSGEFAINDWELIVVSIVMVVLMTVVYFAMLGLLGELAVKASGMHRRGILDRILNELH